MTHRNWGRWQPNSTGDEKGQPPARPGAELDVYTYRVPAIAVLLAAAAFPPSLEAQMRTMQRPGVTARISLGPRFRAVQPLPGRFGVMSPRPLGRRALFVGPVAFRHNLRFSIFFGNTCFTNPFFDPFFCRQFFFRNRFLFAQPAFLP